MSDPLQHVIGTHPQNVNLSSLVLEVSALISSFTMDRAGKTKQNGTLYKAIAILNSSLALKVLRRHTYSVHLHKHTSHTKHRHTHTHTTFIHTTPTTLTAYVHRFTLTHTHTMYKYTLLKRIMVPLVSDLL